jgi:uncharacterized protein (DUF433 family)
MDIVVCHEQQGMSPDEIVSFYPGITLADAHAALAYCFDHRDDSVREASAPPCRLRSGFISNVWG